MQLRNRIAVVTGAGGGIGRALCIELARAGAHVVAADTDEHAAAETVRELAALASSGQRALPATVDVRDPSALQALLRRAVSELGGCHLVCNNAGVFHAQTLIDTPRSEWRRVLDTNLWGVIHGSRIFGAHFRAQGDGHIVNTASAAGLFPSPGMGSYSTTKFAVVGFSQQLRWELADAGVGVTVLCPGVVKTGIARAPGVGLRHADADKIMARAPLASGLARKVVRAIAKNRAMVRYGSDAYAMSFLRVLPMWLGDALGRLMARFALVFLAQQRQPDSTHDVGQHQDGTQR